MSSTEHVSAAKKAWRHTLLERRAAVSETTRSAENAALRGSVLEWVDAEGMAVVCAYVPMGGEPGSRELLDALRERGTRVLLPIVVRGGPLDWAEYFGPDSLRPATFGLLEPTSTRLGSEAIAEADGVLVPALAIDQRGVRLGQGAGYYDRSLPKAGPVPLVGVVRDTEFVEELPGEAHDVRVGGVLTPGRGLVRLPV